MEDKTRPPGYPSTELTPDELGRVAYMCYILNRSWTVRWYHKWCTALERMSGNGWTLEGLQYRGRIRDKLEQIYGLTPRESRTAVAAYPRINMGIEPWQILTDTVVNELAGEIYRSYVGLPAEHGRDYWTAPSHNDGGDTRCEDCNYSYDTDTSGMGEESDDNGRFYFV